jgi:hypothetical protein
MRPIGDPSHPAMLDRIEVNVVEVRVIIPLILDRMLPKSPLPNAPVRVSFAFGLINRCPGEMEQANDDLI